MFTVFEINAKNRRTHSQEQYLCVDIIFREFGNPGEKENFAYKKYQTLIIQVYYMGLACETGVSSAVVAH